MQGGEQIFQIDMLTIQIISILSNLFKSLFTVRKTM